MNDLESITGLAAAPLVIYYITQNAKSAWRYATDTGDTDDSPWPLVSSAVGALWMVGAWASGWLPETQLESPLAAVMLGVGAGAITSKVYETIKK